MSGEQPWEAWMLKRRARILRRLDVREPKRPLSSDTNFSLELPGSSRINENEGGLRTEKLRVSDSTMEIELASSNKLGVESASSDVFLRRN
ncbi:hypothetical protein TNCV_4754281 [Trichonephila clavipes]|nr:hypothetical protein TNCV_4754281 [Trichonephila clavipes]